MGLPNPRMCRASRREGVSKAGQALSFVGGGCPEMAWLSFLHVSQILLFKLLNYYRGPEFSSQDPWCAAPRCL